MRAPWREGMVKFHPSLTTPKMTESDPKLRSRSKAFCHSAPVPHALIVALKVILRLEELWSSYIAS